MSNIILCHGFNVRDAGKETIDELLPYLKDDNVQQADYGYFNLLGVRWFNDNIAATIAGMANDDSIGIGHSNGCAILVEAAKKTPKIKNLVLINPALDRDTKFPPSIERILIFHNTHDRIVTASKWLPWHVWGEMGRVGYTGDDTRVTNIDTYKKFLVSGHSSALIYCAKDIVGHFKMWFRSPTWR